MVLPKIFSLLSFATSPAIEAEINASEWALVLLSASLVYCRHLCSLDHALHVIAKSMVPDWPCQCCALCAVQSHSKCTLPTARSSWHRVWPPLLFHGTLSLLVGSPLVNGLNDPGNPAGSEKSSFTSTSKKHCRVALKANLNSWPSEKNKVIKHRANNLYGLATMRKDAGKVDARANRKESKTKQAS